MHHKFNRTARDPDAYNAGTPSVATVVRFYAVAFFGLPLAIPFFNFLYPLTHMDALQRRRHFRHLLGYAAVHAVVWTGASRDRSCRACTLETPVEPRRPVRRYTYETLRYNAPPAYLDAWARAAPRSLLSLCNNHALDQGLGGLRATRAAVGARGLVCLGGPDAETEAVALLEVGGLRLACIGLTFGINGLARGTAGLPGVPVLEFGDPRARTDWMQVERLIGRARSLNPHWLVALPHWGYEYEYWPCARMRADAHRLLALGIDLILGSSPHVLQPCEVASVNGWDARAPTAITRPGGPPRPALVAYSLGNLASILPTAGCQVGALLGLRLDAQTLLGLDALPTVCRRALGCGWLAARAFGLTEAAPLLTRAERLAYHKHAQRALGPLLKETPP